MKKIYIAIISLLLSDVGLQAQEQDTVRLTLKEAINLAQMQSVYNWQNEKYKFSKRKV